MKKFSELDEEIAKLKQTITSLQTRMDAADNDIGILSVNDSDLDISVYRIHDCVMEEINHKYDKNNVMIAKLLLKRFVI